MMENVYFEVYIYYVIKLKCHKNIGSKWLQPVNCVTLWTLIATIITEIQ